MDSFFDKGKEAWNKYKDFAKGCLCDIEKKEPKETLKEIIDGNGKEIAVNIINLLVYQSLEAAIAIPLCALVIKKGIYKFCE